MSVRKQIADLLHQRKLNVLMEIVFEEHKRVFHEDNIATRYFHLRRALDEAAQKKDLYHGKHPSIDNRGD